MMSNSVDSNQHGVILMSELFSRRTAIAGGIGLASGIGLLATETLAKAAGTQDDQHGHAQEDPSRSRSRRRSPRGGNTRFHPCPMRMTPSSRRSIPRRCGCTMTSTTPRM